MPLLRQSLYAQNINLYLAPTADARDAWLGLMRTVGVEGRCFVVSSNMCVRENQTSTASHNGESLPNRTARRVSCSEDGDMDIALPAAPPSPSRRKRRKSVFDEDGNEIVLCCPPDEKNGTTPNGENREATRKVHPAEKQDAKGGFSCRGGSCIVGPFGEVLAGPQWEDDHGLIFADVDFRDCIKGRLDLDAAGSYSRNDSFQLAVKGLSMDPLPY